MGILFDTFFLTNWLKNIVYIAANFCCIKEKMITVLYWINSQWFFRAQCDKLKLIPIPKYSTFQMRKSDGNAFLDMESMSYQLTFGLVGIRISVLSGLFSLLASGDCSAASETGTFWYCCFWMLLFGAMVFGGRPVLTIANSIRAPNTKKKLTII